MANRIFQCGMTNKELGESYSSSTRLLMKIKKSTENRNFSEALKYNHQIYEIVWQRYLRCDGEHKERACQSLRDLAKESRNLMVLINKWEETA